MQATMLPFSIAKAVITFMNAQLCQTPCLPACLVACPHACLSAHKQPKYKPAAALSSCRFASLPACMHAYLHQLSGQ